MSDTAQWAALAGAIGTAIGALITGVMMTYFKYGGEYRVKVMRAQASLNEEELKRREIEISTKNQAIGVLTTRVEQLEQNIKDIRDSNHKERNNWYMEQLKISKENMDREMRCHKEAAELRGQLAILTRLVSDRLPGPISVKIDNTPDNPVPVRDSKEMESHEVQPATRSDKYPPEKR